MKAIIEIPDEMVRSAGTAIGFAQPKIVDAVIAAMQRLSDMKEIVLQFDKKEDRRVMEENTALLIVSQVIGEIIDSDGRQH